MGADQSTSTGGGVVRLTGPGESTNVVYHALKDRLPMKKAVIEEPILRREFTSQRP